MKRMLSRATLIVVALFAFGLAGLWGWMQSSLPRTEGEVAVPGLAQPVTLARDRHGLVTVRAETAAGGWFGLGFAHAQDRLWQMESLRRFARGRLSEVIGAATAEIDAAQRRLRLGALAARQFRALSAETQAALRAYAAGINAFLETRAGALPPEFVALGFAPEPWLPEDGLLWGRLMAYQLSGRWREDLVRAELIESVGIDKLRELWPAMRADTVRLSNAPRAAVPPPYLPPPRGASNAWAVAPARSATGAPLLAGDPHLGLGIPGTWYMARIEAGGRRIEGATAPGVPFVIMGRNDALAWAVTSSEADLQDVVRIGADDVTWRETASVAIEGAAPNEIVLMESDGAPVIAGGLLDGSGDDGIALLATALIPDDTTPEAFHRLNTATTVADGIAALRQFRAPFMNFFLADSGGGIARVHAGDLPRRLGYSGRLPLDTTLPRWRAVPVHALLDPVRNPPAGIVANANERTAELDALDFAVAGDWPAPARARRLADLLADQSHPRDTDWMAAMQTDTVDVTAEIWHAALRAMPLENEAAGARETLLRWDGAMDRDQAAPLIYATWMAALKRALFLDELGERFGAVMLPGPARMAAMIAAGSAWCDDVKTEVREACAALPERAYRDAVDILIRFHGDDPDAWRWGDAHAVYFEHRLLTRVPFIGGLFGRHTATDGGDRTLNRGASPRLAGANGRFPNVHGAGFRAVHDLAGGPSRYIAVPGQSGNPFSEHYDDLIDSWRDGGYLEFGAAPTAILTLRPVDQQSR